MSQKKRIEFRGNPGKRDTKPRDGSPTMNNAIFVGEITKEIRENAQRMKQSATSVIKEIISQECAKIG